MSEITSFISIQGSIGSGKTSLLNEIKKYITNHGLSALDATPGEASETGRDLYLILDEPVADWCEVNCSLLNCDGKGKDKKLYSHLGLFYKGMTKEEKEVQPPYKAMTEREAKTGFQYTDEYGLLRTDGVWIKEDPVHLNPYASSFQIKTFTTRLRNTCDQLDKLPKFNPESKTRVHIISERSLRTDRLFFKNVYESGQVAQYEWDTYEGFHDIICRATMKKEDAMVYINTGPVKCHERIHEKRKRNAEVGTGIPLDYLQSLHKQHEEMISNFRKEKGEDRLIEVDFEKDMSQEEIAELAASLMQRFKHITQ